jgi:hypothetical protein
MHDWTKVEAGIYHAFHHEWISEIGRTLNRGLLPDDFYALPEQQASGFGPDVLTLQELHGPRRSGSASTTTITQPKTRFRFEAPSAFYRRKKSTIVVRHVSDDRLPDMPLFLDIEEFVNVPLEQTYDAAWNAVPKRWQRVIDQSIK